MFTTAQIRAAMRDLQAALDAIRAREETPAKIAITVGMLGEIALILAYFSLVDHHSVAATTWLPPVEIGAFVLLTVIVILGGSEAALWMLRKYSARMRREYALLCALIAQEPHRSIAERVRIGRLRYPKDDADDPRNLEYSGIISRA